MVTYAGLDVHARSTHAAAIDVSTGELVRARFGPGIEEPVAWLAGLPGPVRACYEAGPTGFGLYRAAVAAGVDLEVIAPGKTPRGPSDRVKTDRKDAELLARLLLAGSLTTVVVPPVEVEAARELMRSHDACRRDLMTARHRVSKMLLRHGRVYPESSTWTVAHRRWLSAQQFDEAVSDLVFADLIAAVDGLAARKATAVGHQHRGFQPTFHIQQDPFLVRVARQSLQRQIPRNRAEKVTDVNIQHPWLLEAPLPANRHRFQRRASGTVAVGVIVENLLHAGLQGHSRRRLRDSVNDIWYA
jgi:transposase